MAMAKQNANHLVPGAESHENAAPDNPPEAVPTPTDTESHLSGSRFFLVIVAACTSAFLVGLDQTVVTTAIPQITDDFKTPGDVGWYGSAYLLTSCAFQPIFGQLYKLFGLRTIYFGSLAMFLVGSLLCALAPTSTALIVGRALAGVGCAGVIAGNLNLVARSAPLRKRPLYVAWIGAVFGVALVCGPIIGGAFTSRVNWRWCFWINLPVGALVFAIVIFFYRPPKAQGQDHNTPMLRRLLGLDWVGGFLVLVTVVMLLLALQWGGDQYQWSNSRIVGLLVGAGAGSIVFTLWQWHRGTSALVPLHLLRDHTVAGTMLAAFFQSGATFVPIFYLPYWFQAVKLTSSIGSGVDLIPWMAGNFVAAMTGGFLVNKTGWFNPFLLVGPAIGAIGAGLLVTLTPETSTGKWIGYQILNGVGLGLARQQYFVAPQAVLSPADIPFAVSFVLFSQNLAGSIMVSVGNALLRNSLRNSLADHPNFSQSLTAQQILDAGPTAVQTLVPADQLGQFIGFYNSALRDVWILAVPLCLLSIITALPVRWINLRHKSSETEKGGVDP